MPDLKIPPEKAILLLSERRDSLAELKKTAGNSEYYDLPGWCSKIWQVIDGIYGSGGLHSEEIWQIGITPCSCSKCGGVPMQLEIYHTRLQKYIDEIEAGMPVQQ